MAHARVTPPTTTRQKLYKHGDGWRQFAHLPFRRLGARHHHHALKADRGVLAHSHNDTRVMRRRRHRPHEEHGLIELSPLVMPHSDRVYTFPALPYPIFHGLPRLLADALPDGLGKALPDAWLALQGGAPQSFDAVERRRYTGSRGMGALELVPTLDPVSSTASRIEIEAPIPDWSRSVFEWRQAMNQFAIVYGDRFTQSA